MICRSEKIVNICLAKRGGFSLAETLAALAILALICSSVFLVVEQCMSSAADIRLKMNAYEVARENMETLLSSESAQEHVDYGTSERYPEISWETKVETISAPGGVTWLSATCSAEYVDTKGEPQKIEFTNWLTNLSKEQSERVQKEKEREKQWLAKQDKNNPDNPQQADGTNTTNTQDQQSSTGNNSSASNFNAANNTGNTSNNNTNTSGGQKRRPTLKNKEFQNMTPQQIMEKIKEILSRPR